MSVISGALLVPVLCAVLLCFACMLIALGTFFRDCSERRGQRRTLKALAASCDDSDLDPSELWIRLQGAKHPLTAFVVRGLPSFPVAADVVRKRLTDLENDFSVRIARMSFLTRIGPMLGLLGTLIPLGPALAGLGSGNVQQLSGGLVVAFAATVVGLVAACMSYGIGLVRRSWSERDMDDLDYIVNRLYPERT
jgi:biopolymer transport protein ExbB/TolQ